MIFKNQKNCIKIINKKKKDNIYFNIAMLFIKENGLVKYLVYLLFLKVILDMDKELKYGQMELNMKVSGKIIRFMEKAFFTMLMEIFLMVNG